jgi:DNA modification methylase
LTDTEYILFFREKGVKVYGTYETKKTYYVTPTNQKEKKLYGHPTIKPQEILKNLIVNSTTENGVVLDCFMGSGSTGVACVNTNRNFIGIEIDEGYFNIAKKRIEEAYDTATSS